MFNPMPELKIKRVKLREISINDLDDFYEYSSCSDVTRYISYTHKSRDEAKKYIENKQDLYKKGECMIWGIEELSSKKFIGACGFTSWDKTNNSGEIAYTLNKSHWGKGFGGEIFNFLLDFGFNKMNLNRVEAKCWKDNIKSKKLMLKHGMQFEGAYRSQLFVKGDYKDIIVCSILRDEYLR